MKRLERVRRGMIALAAMLGPLYGLDRLPTPSCQDRDNLRILHRCDPYAVHFVRVDLRQIQSTPRSLRRLAPPKRPEAVLPFQYERRLNLQHLVERYIECEEAILRRRQVSKEVQPSGQIPPKTPSQKKIPIKAKVAPKEEEEHPRKEAVAPPVVTVAEYFGPRDPSKLVMGLERRSVAYPGKFQVIKAAPPPTARGPIVHTVAPGETLSALARDYQTTLYDIRRWNRLKRDHLLNVGEKLTIHPGVRTPPEQIREALRREKFGFYKVQKGDSLIAIARRFKVKAKEIRFLNALKKKNHLRVGQKLMLPLEQKKIDAVLKKERRFKYASHKRFRHKLRVTATAYTSHRSQTDRTPFIAAWNNRIRPGMKIIAVSPDLIRRYGITNGTKVKISGLPGIYTVRDKMHPKWWKRIDIYMGTNRRKALRWGRRSVILYW